MTGIKMSEDIRNFLEDSKYHLKISKWCYSCSFCARCNEICPRGVNRQEIKDFLKIELAKNHNNKIKNFGYLLIPPFFNLNFPGMFPFFKEYFKSISPKRSKFFERRSIKNSGQKDVVLFTGCGINALPDSLNSLFDIMSVLNIDYGILQGTHKNACCGRIDLELGNWTNTEKLAKILIDELKRFKPSTVLVYCTSCYYMLKKVIPYYVPYEFEVKHCTEYIGELKSEIQASIRQDMKVTIAPFDSCHMRESKQFNGIRNCFKYAGFQVKELKHSKSKSLCCISGLLNNGVLNGLTLSNHPVLKEAKNIKDLNILTNLCTGCHLILSLYRHVGFNKFGYRFEVENWPVTLSKAFGQNYPNYLKSLMHPTFLFKNLRIAIKAGAFNSILKNII
ncbi:MAG: (Fe-S)-binding protein [Candidatus Lokiarchaeota archaeon]|nr:(Fe-S)-binding protein [Candidatus Lokiarchaeota archaeon]